MHLCTRTARLYLLPSRTPSIEPSAISSASMPKSQRPESWNHTPRIDIILQIVWNVTKRRMVLWYMSVCFQTNSMALANRVPSPWPRWCPDITLISVSQVLTVLRFLKTVDNSVAGALFYCGHVSDDIRWDNDGASGSEVEYCPARYFLCHYVCLDGNDPEKIFVCEQLPMLHRMLRKMLWLFAADLAQHAHQPCIPAVLYVLQMRYFLGLKGFLEDGKQDCCNGFLWD